MSKLPILQMAEKLHESAIIYYQDRPVGTIAAQDPDADALNYDQCFVRDFVPSAFVFLVQKRHDIVRNFLVETLALQKQVRRVDGFEIPLGLMPASFKVQSEAERQYLTADFGDHAIGRVTPIDSCLWWIIILRAYVKASGDTALAKRPDFQEGLHLILQLCLSSQFEMSPTLLVPDAACMIDRRMGIDGHPLEIQALFYGALRSARELLMPSSDGEDWIRKIDDRQKALLFRVRHYYWLDLEKLNEIHRYKGDQFGESVMNKFNIYPDSIPYWLTEWMPDWAGYLAGNLGPSRMDFRFFALGNLMAIITSLADATQSQQIMDLIELQWDDLVGRMPMKICFPAVEGLEWRITTGSDPKNTPWSYHNGGSWPVLLWMLMAAAIKTKRQKLGEKAWMTASYRFEEDEWPEYYDGKNGRLVGKSSRKYQTWTIASFLLTTLLQDKPEQIAPFIFDDEDSTENSL